MYSGVYMTPVWPLPPPAFWVQQHLEGRYCCSYQDRSRKQHPGHSILSKVEVPPLKKHQIKSPKKQLLTMQSMQICTFPSLYQIHLTAAFFQMQRQGTLLIQSISSLCILSTGGDTKLDRFLAMLSYNITQCNLLVLKVEGGNSL